MNIIEELKRTPIKRNLGFDYDDYKKRKEYYHGEVIPKIPVDSNNERYAEQLKRCSEFGIFQFNYYVNGPGREILRASGDGESPYVSKDILLRESILVKLRMVDNELRKHNLRLLVLSGYRHPEHQRECLEGVKAQNRPLNARSANKLFTNPKVYSPHCTGAALDVEIWSDIDCRMLPTKLPDRETTMGLFFLEQLSTLNWEEEETKANRRLLHNILATPVILGKDHFVHHPSEYWHYAWGERMAGFFSANGHPVCYERIFVVA